MADERARTQTQTRSRPSREREDSSREREEPNRKTEDSQKEPRDARPRRRIGTSQLVETAKRELAALIGREVDSTYALVERDGGWCVTVEMVELERIPPTTSVLGSYEVQLDERGEVLGFERVRRYMRSEANG